MFQKIREILNDIEVYFFFLLLSVLQYWCLAIVISYVVLSVTFNVSFSSVT